MTVRIWYNTTYTIVYNMLHQKNSVIVVNVLLTHISDHAGMLRKKPNQCGQIKQTLEHHNKDFK